MTIRDRVAIGIIVFFVIASLVPPAHAQSATPFDFILSDFEFTNTQSWNKETITRFLAALPGTLATRRVIDKDGIEWAVPDLIATVSETHGINPKVLLATLQKEQSLLEDPQPSQDQLDWAMGYGVCDACTHGDPAIQRFRGFVTQVRGAAEQYRYYTDHPEEFGFRPGTPTMVDGLMVTPENRATAALFNYTPHLAGNLRFRELWRKYFIRRHTEGSLLQVRGEETVWYIHYGQRRLIASHAVLLSRFDPNTILPVERFELEQYPEGLPVRFPEYALLLGPRGGRYLLVNDVRRKIPTRELFRHLGFQEVELIPVSREELRQYPEGDPLSEKNLYPIGALIQDPKKGGIFYVIDGKKHPITDRSIRALVFAERPVIRSHNPHLDQFTLGAPVLLRDGTLVRAHGIGGAYVIDGGKRRRIISPNVFTSRGYQWKNVKMVPPRVLLLHPEGEPIDF